MRWKSLPHTPARRLRTRTQPGAGNDCRGRFCTCSGAKEAKYAPCQKRPNNWVRNTRLGLSSRVEVHMAGILLRLLSHLVFVRFRKCTILNGVGQCRSKEVRGIIKLSFLSEENFACQKCIHALLLCRGRYLDPKCNVPKRGRSKIEQYGNSYKESTKIAACRYKNVGTRYTSKEKPQGPI